MCKRCKIFFFFNIFDKMICFCKIFDDWLKYTIWHIGMSRLSRGIVYVCMCVWMYGCSRIESIFRLYVLVYADSDSRSALENNVFIENRLISDSGYWIHTTINPIVKWMFTIWFSFCFSSKLFWLSVKKLEILVKISKHWPKKHVSFIW